MTEKVDVLFINPGNRKEIYQALGNEFTAIEPPAFAGLFASYLRIKGVSVAILDAPALGLNSTQVTDLAFETYEPTMIALAVYGYQPSASTQNMTAAGQVASRVKETHPDVPVFMTGTHPAALPKRTMIDEDVDFVCDLEGPITIKKTVEALKAGVTDFSEIPSLWWRDSEDKIRAPQSAEGLVKNLDEEMPGIAWDLLPMEKYRSHNWHSFAHIDERAPYASIHTSLGCPYKCSFCCINAPFGKPSYRMWKPESVIAEIDRLVYDYGIYNIKFVDEMFVLNKKHVTEICNLLISRPYKVNIWAYARVDTVQDDWLDMLKAAGFNWLCLGIESASGTVRDGAHKIYGNDDIIEVVRKIQAAGIYIIGNYIFGLPDDTQERMQGTLDLAMELNCEFANFYSAMAYPGSRLYDMAVQKGTPLPAEWHHFSQHGYQALPLANDYVTATEILEFRDKAFERYFDNPVYLDMVREKFGQDVVEHINRMRKIPLKRKLFEEAEAKKGAA
ncbi:MAG: B12-binding domain-containing radical SAM protein [Myxococcota bacterium]|nr:B12-binding domain-containing radical SAM protein [Myxococcota bacterium]